MASYKMINSSGESDINEDALAKKPDLYEDDAQPSEPKTRICGVDFTSLSLLVISGVIFAGLVTLGLLISIALGMNDKMKAKVYVRGAVASDSGVCSEIGFDILKKKGSAVDASIATLTCLGVVRMQSAGIGGGGVMLIRNATGNVDSIDYREAAPAAASQTMFDGNSSSLAHMGGLAVAVPGQLKGLSLAHELHGKLSWSELILPSVNLAKTGFSLEQPTYDWADRRKEDLKRESPQLYGMLFSADGTQVPVGSKIKLPALAAMLQVIADSGSGDVVYNGSSFSEGIVDSVRAAGGIMTLQDLAGYTAVVRPALSTKIRENIFFTTPPPSSGASLLSMLGILGGYGKFSGDALSYHRMVEAIKFAFVRRSELGDPDMETSVDAAVAKMISREQSDLLRQMIMDNTTQELSFYGPIALATSAPGTVQVSVVTGEQEAVSVTESIGSPFGSLVATADGILLNNAMNDFSVPSTPNSHGFPPAEVNFIKPGKRPLSSMSPVIVVHTDKNDTVAVRSVLGAGGGPSIPSTVLQVVLSMLDRGMDVGGAISSKRLYQRLIPDFVAVEEGMSADIITGLRGRGHDVVVTNHSIGHCSAVYQNDASPRRLKAASDRRNSGIASYGVLYKT